MATTQRLKEVLKLVGTKKAVINTPQVLQVIIWELMKAKTSSTKAEARLIAKVTSLDKKLKKMASCGKGSKKLCKRSSTKSVVVKKRWKTSKKTKGSKAQLMATAMKVKARANKDLKRTK